MIPMVCIDSSTNTIRHFQDFRDDEVLPQDLAHKNLIWRKVVEVHTPFDPEMEQESGTSIDITETDCIITHLIVPKPPVVPETPEQHQSRTLRFIQTHCFTPETLPLSMVIFELYNEVQMLKGEPELKLEDFKRALQRYAS